MMYFRIFIICYFLCGSVSPLHANSPSLQDLYLQAIKYDAEYAADHSAYKAEQENKALGLANLLPNISVALEANPTHVEQEVGGRKIDDQDFTSRLGVLRLTQPLFDLDRFAAYSLGKAQAKLGEAVFAEAKQSLILRMTEAYLNYLLELNNLELAKAQKDAIAAQKELAINLLRGRMGTVTDVEETKARYQIARAKELAVRNNIGIKRKELEKIAGSFPDISAHDIDSFNLVLPEPNDLALWVEAAKKQNLQAQIKMHAVRVAEYGLDRAKAGHYPSLLLTGSIQREEYPENELFVDQKDTYQIGVQLSMPLYEGGHVHASSQQALFRLEQAKHELAASQAESEVLLTKAFLGLINGFAQIAALEQAVKSSEITLEGMDAERKVGFRTYTDVLNAQQQLFETKRDLQRERYTYLFNTLMLKASVGSLDESELATIDTLITE